MFCGGLPWATSSGRDRVAEPLPGLVGALPQQQNASDAGGAGVPRLRVCKLDDSYLWDRSYELVIRAYRLQPRPRQQA